MFSQKWKTPIYTVFALGCFAANSVLNRMALGGGKIDASSYIGMRLVTGAAALWIMHASASRKWNPMADLDAIVVKGSLLSAFWLLLYGIAFSFAYLSLAAGMGAFILFGTVQTTMLATSYFQGDRPTVATWVGLAIAVSGLAYLTLPGLSAPDPLGSALMVVAGIAWGIYTLRGKRSQKSPLETTTLNFVFSVPMVLLFCFFMLSGANITWEGAVYATLSGVVASGMGYVAWYAALRGLGIAQAALLQLLVPIIAALGGVALLSEAVTTRLLIAGLMIVAGIALALFGKGNR